MFSNGRRYETITFDMGYTLVNLHSSFTHTLVELAARWGRAYTIDEIRAVLRRVWEERNRLDATLTWEPSIEADDAAALEIDRITCHYLGIDDPEFVTQVNRCDRADFWNPATFRVFPDVCDTLSTLRLQGSRLGIVSNWDWYLPDRVREAGLDQYFDFVVSSAHVGASKPHPAIFNEALARAGSPPERTLHIGDSLAADVRGAQAVGIAAVLLDRDGVAMPGDFPIVRGLEQLVPLVNHGWEGES